MRRSPVAGLVLALLALSGPVAATEKPVAPRVVGGVEAGPTEFPFLVGLIHSADHSVFQGQFCGGTLIDPEWVLTAGHCVEGETAESIDVYANDYDLKGDGDRIVVAEVYSHPGYDGFSLENDVALLHLAVPAKASPAANDTVRLAIGADRSRFAPGESVTTAGWGATDNNPPGTPFYPDRVRKVEVPVQSDADCAIVYNSFTAPENICAGFAVGGADSCQGDSGGPLMVAFGDGTYLQVGVVSWGQGCGEPGYFGVYTLVVPYACWIAETMDNGTLGYGRATTAGTAADDHMIGTPGDDVFLGLGGDDVIEGGDGADVLCGGDGGDSILGGSGFDVIDGGAGADTLRGNSGADYLLGGAGDDSLKGDNGVDGMLGGPGADLMSGGKRDDALDGEGDSDVIRGGAGNDTLKGNDGADLAIGNRGSDIVRGGGGADELRGGPGDDELSGGSGFDDLTGGSGSDVCDGEVLGGCEG